MGMKLTGAAALAGWAVASAAAAQEIAVRPLAEARVRYEHDEQAGLAKPSDDVVVRVRAGVEATRGPWSLLGQAQGTLAVVNRYYDGLHGVPDRPIVYDPQDVALYRAQIRYKSHGLTATAGRQRITLHDQRFVGAGDWRINGQTFDAVRGEWQLLPAVKADVAYVRAIRTFWGVDGRGARPPGIGGNSVLANLDVKTPVGTAVGFAYLVDEDSVAVQNFQLQSQTFGARLLGDRVLRPGLKLAYKATWARQSNRHRNPNRFAATYLQLDATLSPGPLSLNAGFERLGADRRTGGGGTALTSVQFAFGTNFLYQGWANKFLTTPTNGLHDLYGGAGWTWKRLGPLSGVLVQAAGHRFTSDIGGRHDGDEADVLVQGRLGRTTLALRFADYRADAFATDTRKLWLQAEWAL